MSKRVREILYSSDADKLMKAIEQYRKIGIGIFTYKGKTYKLSQV